jgi:hypothetical protein
VRDIKVTSPGEAPQERKEVAHGASRGEDCEIDQAPADLAKWHAGQAEKTVF